MLSGADRTCPMPASETHISQHQDQQRGTAANASFSVTMMRLHSRVRSKLVSNQGLSFDEREALENLIEAVGGLLRAGHAGGAGPSLHRKSRPKTKTTR